VVPHGGSDIGLPGCLAALLLPVTSVCTASTNSSTTPNNTISSTTTTAAAVAAAAAAADNTSSITDAITATIESQDFT
jgi:hypothetical protein